MRPSVTVIMDKRRKSTTGENKNKFPIKIKVNFKVREGRKNRYVVRRYPTGLFCKPVDFNKVKNDSQVILLHAKAVELHGKHLSMKDFERMLTGSGGLEDIKSVFDYAIAKLREEGRDGTALAYSNALASFTLFKGDYIAFASITVDWLKEYERWMKKPRVILVGRGKKKKEKVIQPRSITTVGMYLRALRTIFNLAIDPMKIISRDLFPFGVRKYVIPSGKRKTKKAFTREERSTILSYRSERGDINRALDFWAYQYFSSGCNMADVAYLQNKNLDGEWVTFDRKKTENTERDKTSIEVFINTRMREVITKHGKWSLNEEDYVFPILKPDMTSAQRKSRIRDFIKETNELLAEAQKEIEQKTRQELSVKLTTGTARYTAATLLKRHGIDLTTIAKALGHGSEATTEHYTEETRETQKMISKALAM